MSTQALITIVPALVSPEVTLAKIITGCDGGAAPELAVVLRKSPHFFHRVGQLMARNALEVEDAVLWLYEKAEAELGCDSCLVVQGRHGVIHYKGDEELDPRYQAKFDEPFFNPRWDGGTADFILALDLTGRIYDFHTKRLYEKKELVHEPS